MLGIGLQLGIWGFKASRQCFYRGHREYEASVYGLMAGAILEYNY